jgi:SsrA-binding protein
MQKDYTTSNKYMPVYTKNKKARFNFEILDEIEAGLVLSGQETKSIRTGGARLQGAFVSLREDGAYLANMHIAKYKYSAKDDKYNPTQDRKLLLNKKELDYLRGKSQEKGLTIIPLSVYTKGRFIKISLGTARGKKKHDKRETIKKRDVKKEIERALKRG